MNLFEKTIKSDEVYAGKVVRLRIDEVLLPNGNRSKREIVEHPGAVAIVPRDEKGNVLLVRQFRKAPGKELLEVPAGKLEEGEEPEVCAQRELAEEIGFQAEELIFLSSFYTSPGFCNEKVHLYLAERLSPAQRHIPEDEFIEPVKISFPEAIEKIQSGEIEDAKTIAGILLATQRE